MTAAPAAGPPFVLLHDGRRLAYAEYGAPDGTAVVLAHGGPGSRLEFAPLDADARAAGLRLICPERPGYGCSDPAPPGYSFAWGAKDTATLADRLGLDRFVCAGVSTGGMHALAAAAILPDRIAKAVVVSGMFPLNGAAARRLLGIRAWALFALARLAPGLFARIATWLSARYSTEEGIRKAPGLSDLDRQALLDDPAIFDAYVADQREALRNGPGGMVTDALLYASGTPGVDLGCISCPVVFVHGAQDHAVPSAVAQLASRQVPGSAVRLIAGQGHLFFAREPRYMLEEMGGTQR